MVGQLAGHGNVIGLVEGDAGRVARCWRRRQKCREW